MLCERCAWCLRVTYEYVYSLMCTGEDCMLYFWNILYVNCVMCEICGLCSVSFICPGSITAIHTRDWWQSSATLLLYLLKGMNA